MTNSRSMTRRLILGLGSATLLVWISVPTIAALKLIDIINHLSDNLLEQSAKALEPVLMESRKGLPKSEYVWYIDSDPPSEAFWTYRYQIRNRKGDVLYYSASKEPFPDTPAREGFSQAANDRIYTLEKRDGNTLRLAEPLHLHDQSIDDGAVFIAAPILVCLPLGIALWWMVIRRSLAPIEVLREEIGSRDGSNLSPLGLIDLPAELIPIGASVDRLLERLRAALDAERESAANIAHELQTPIAGSLAQMQRLLAELPQGPAKARARGIEESLLNLGSRVGKLLQLARAESGIGIADIAVDLVRVVRLEIEDLGKKPEYAGRLILDVDGCLSLMRHVDIDACGIFLRNLIENALKHGLPDTAVTVSVRPDGTIAIANAGAVVSIPDLEEITERFSRGATRASGSGLGLHIATMVIERIGGSLELVSPARGREDGFEAIVRIPQ
ncbi:sensor histidine kinase [Sinorhizobium meliloti]|uniref:sensor histidine kinase n=1 Tax=Rhizobium meliloti TaxID=382 RepID=UPI000EFCBBC8|nr:HAMP domain-containing sensor histidine kinase [Sinorhizobium meliloti]RMI15016.1 sensor histidine kinase [Sinorhizobium meliloti]